MPKTFRPPRLGEPGYSIDARTGPGPGSPMNSQHCQRRAEALRGVALEILFNRNITPQDQCDVNAETYGKFVHERVPAVDLVRKEISKLSGACDRMFRAAPTGTSWKASWGRDGAPCQVTSFFRDACSCFRSPVVDSMATDTGGAFEDPDVAADFAAFTQSVCAYEVSYDAYGVAGGVTKLQRDALHQFNIAARLTATIVEELVKSGVFYNQVDINSDVRDILARIQRWMSQLHPDRSAAFMQRMEGRILALKSARSCASLLKARVSSHLRDRELRGVHPLEEADDDVIENIAKYLTPRSASALMQTCVKFRKTDAIQRRLPHLRIRQVIGTFPHYRAVSRDRQDLAEGVSKPVMRDFVVSGQAVRLYVDFVLPSVRSAPLKKLPRKDGLANDHHEFSDDEFETPPEAQSRRGPQPQRCDFAEGTEWHQRHMEAEARRRRNFELADGPEERFDRFTYMCRINQLRYFEASLKCTVQLVYADTKEPVQCNRYKHALKLSNKLSRDEGVFSAPSGWVDTHGICPDDHLPAVAKFHVPHLSTNHGGRLFRLRISGTGRVCGTRLHGGTDCVQVVYSNPFEVVSKLIVAKKASTRLTPEQTSQDRSKRAKHACGRSTGGSWRTTACSPTKP